VRGCLFVLVLAAAVLGAFAWFGSPVLAATVIQAALENAGYHATTSTISATSDPPPKLLLGRADRVEIDGTGVAFRTFHAARLDLTLTDVDVVARTAATISGRIVGAELEASGTAATTADVEIDGPASDASATIEVDGATVDRLVKAAFAARFGVAPSGTELVAPNTLRVTAPGATIEGRFGVDADGAIALTTRLGATPVFRFDPSFPLRLTSIAIVDGRLRIGGVLDAEALLGG
jgi:hypothetical protein